MHLESSLPPPPITFLMVRPLRGKNSDCRRPIAPNNVIFPISVLFLSQYNLTVLFCSY